MELYSIVILILCVVFFLDPFIQVILQERLLKSVKKSFEEYAKEYNKELGLASETSGDSSKTHRSR